MDLIKKLTEDDTAMLRVNKDDIPKLVTLTNKIPEIKDETLQRRLLQWI